MIMKNEFIIVHNEHPEWLLVTDGGNYRYAPHGFPMTFSTFEEAKSFINRFEYLKSRGNIKNNSHENKI